MQDKTFFDKTTKKGRQHRDFLKVGILLAGMLAAGGCYLSMQGKENSFPVFEEQVWQEQLSSAAGQQKTELQTAEQEEFQEQEAAESETEMLLYVHVCGQVKEPGVYQLPTGARVYDAVQLAGGLTEEAFEEAVNLAETVADGEQIRIPDRTETESFALEEQQAESGLVNLNTATKEQLMTLTGIGEARAKDIIAYREEHGNFQSIEDIMKIPGIKEAAFAKIEKDIVVK